MQPQGIGRMAFSALSVGLLVCVAAPVWAAVLSTRNGILP